MPYTSEEERWREYHVTPRYLAGSGTIGDPGFAPVADWPHHHLDDGDCQLVVTSPDHRIRIGWFGDDYDLWKISAAGDPVSAPRWTAIANQNTPSEIVAGLTSALARDYADGNNRFLANSSMHWTDGVQPLFDAGWTRSAAERGTVEIVAPDGHAGVLIDNRLYGAANGTWTLWAGPRGWGTRAEIVFTARTPSHLISATAAAMADPSPVVRLRRQIHRDVEHLVSFAPVAPNVPAAEGAPTPLDARRAAVTAAVARAAHAQQADLRVRAAHSRTTTPAARAGVATAVRPNTTAPTVGHSQPRPRR
ncbi:DUF317 domain-containing protein [Streptantibioticus ferralitis]|uniref:DUF317 domain-containing protein n=1 Tax=Streptantibioticus ferralitis TaxID=236510 RepID=A0ABT5YU79_9ACTN|nr:DUF317 domain-containing protein [Streptantibioticus ferralitis]MDF2254355.1 DUF317 domain-containing protein [Streptantibioticus ferralitis]